MDVKFVLQDENGARTEKTIALPHTALLAVSRDAGRKMDDPWCSRLAELHLLHLVETGEDMEKDLVTVTLPDLAGTQRRREKLKKGPCCNASPRLGSGIRVWSPSPYPTSNATPPKAA